MRFPKPARGTFRKERRRRQGSVEARRRKVYAAVDRRDAKRCRYCGRADTLSHHHIWPRGTGGPDETWNIVTLCADCHSAAQNGTPRLVAVGNPDEWLTFKWRWEWPNK